MHNEYRTTQWQHAKWIAVTKDRPLATREFNKKKPTPIPGGDNSGNHEST